MESTWHDGWVQRRKAAEFQQTQRDLAQKPLGPVLWLPSVPRSVSCKLRGFDARAPREIAGRSVERCSSSASLTVDLASEIDITSKSKTLATFLNRQGRHEAAIRRQKLGSERRVAIHRANKDSENVFLGAQGLRGFQIYLNQRFGSAYAGWQALDPDCLDRLTFYEFSNSCRRVGYHGNMKRLWRELDVNLRGVITLRDIDSESGELVGRFREQLKQNFGDLLTAWKIGLDPNGAGSLLEIEFLTRCQALRVQGDVAKLFRLLTSSIAFQGHGLTLAAFDAEAYRRHVRCEAHPASITESSVGRSLPAAASESCVESCFLQRSSASSRKTVVEQVHIGVHDAAGLKKALLVRFGSPLAAWRQALDLDGNGRITWNEFCTAMTRLGYTANIKLLWEQLGAKNGALGFEDYDEEAGKALKEMYEKLRQKHGNMLLAWLRGVDRRREGRVGKKPFLKMCKDIGFAGNAQNLWKVMKPDAARRTITLRDFDPAAYRSMIRGDYRMLTEGEGGLPKGPNLHKLSFEERQFATFFHQMRLAWAVARREEFAKSTGEVPEFVVDTPEEFTTQCIRRYGSIISAWRQCLDIDGNGRLTFNEFCVGCRKMGYEGSLRGLWEQFGGKRGHVALRDLDPKADELVSSFLQMLTERYGSIVQAWTRGFKKDLHETIDEPTIEGMCSTLRYKHSAQKLFHCLRPFNGSTMLSVLDIDPTCERNRQRDDSQHHAKHINKDDGHAHARNPQESHDLVLALARKRHGSTTAGWRNFFEGRDVNGVCFKLFILLLEDIGFDVNSKSVFAHIAGDSAEEAVVTFAKFDPTAKKLLDRIRSVLIDRFGSLTASWAALCESYLDSTREAENSKINESGSAKITLQRKKNFEAWHLDEDSFVLSCRRLNLDFKKPVAVFRLLLKGKNSGQRCLERADLRALLLGESEVTATVVWGAIENENKKEFSNRAHSEKCLKEFHAKNLREALSWDEVKAMLSTKWGSVFSAWHNFLDVDDNQLVTKEEFMEKMREFGMRNVKNLWTQVDRSEQGRLSFRELEPIVFDELNLLEKLLLQKYECLAIGWNMCFLKSSSEQLEAKQVDERKFVKGCRSLGMLKCNLKAFFKALQPEPGRTFLMYEDLWRNVNKNATTVDVPNHIPCGPGVKETRECRLRVRNLLARKKKDLNFWQPKLPKFGVHVLPEPRGVNAEDNVIKQTVGAFAEGPAVRDHVSEECALSVPFEGQWADESADAPDMHEPRGENVENNGTKSQTDALQNQVGEESPEIRAVSFEGQRADPLDNDETYSPKVRDTNFDTVYIGSLLHERQPLQKPSLDALSDHDQDKPVPFPADSERSRSDLDNGAGVKEPERLESSEVPLSEEAAPGEDEILAEGDQDDMWENDFEETSDTESSDANEGDGENETTVDPGQPARTKSDDAGFDATYEEDQFEIDEEPDPFEESAE